MGEFCGSGGDRFGPVLVVLMFLEYFLMTLWSIYDADLQSPSSLGISLGLVCRVV